MVSSKGASPSGSSKYIKKHNSSTIVMRLTVLYLGCALLVVFYVNLFPVLEIVFRLFGDPFIKGTTVGIPIAAAGGILFYFGRSSRKITSQTDWISVIIGLTICLSALFIPDPKVSIKRIHVSEYLLLSFFVRYVMSHKMQAGALLFFSSFFTAILGIHDEFLQGLHPQRTYGLRDMMVNGVAGVGGALIWHGFNLFSRDLENSQHSRGESTIHFVYLIVLSLTLLIFPAQLHSFPSPAIPLWPCLSLLAVFSFYFFRIRNDGSAWSHGLMVTSYSSFLLLFYPLLAVLMQR